MPRSKKKNNPSKSEGVGVGLIAVFIVVLLAALAFLIGALLYGNNVALLNPQGFIAHEQRSLMVVVIDILMVIAVPAVGMIFFTAWKYRESNTKAAHEPNARISKIAVAGMWLVPAVFLVAVAAILWTATHRLEPQKVIASHKQPLTIQVIALRWKWLFIYPEQHIATVNFVQIPTDTPVTFKLTADDAPMSSFWIPNLGGMLYAMTGHVNRLNLMADTAGDYPGSTGEINGAGFAGMKFTARASSQDDFDQWVREMKASTEVLDSEEYSSLLQPSEDNPTAYYASADPDLYDTVVMKYMRPSEHENHTAGTTDGHTHDMQIEHMDMQHQ